MSNLIDIENDQSDQQDAASPAEKIPEKNKLENARPVGIDGDPGLQFGIRGHSINPLVDAAQPLFGLVICVRRGQSPPDAEALYRTVCDEITAAREEARQLGYDTVTQLAFSYALCTYVDEAVMTTPWGRASTWSDRSLLSYHHNETSGGEKFFSVLARMQMDPVRHQHMLELKCMCLCLGFQGKYAQQHDGRAAIKLVRTALYQILRPLRGEPPTRLTDEPVVFSRRPRLERQWPLWMPWAVAALVLTSAYSYFSISLANITEEVVRSLNLIIGS